MRLYKNQAFQSRDTVPVSFRVKDNSVAVGLINEIQTYV